MEAHSRWAAGALNGTRARNYQELLALPAALVLVGLLLSSAALLVARRSVGALSDPLAGGSLLLVGLCVATAVVAARTLAGRSNHTVSLNASLFLQWGPTVAVAMFAVALAIEGTSLPALMLYLVLIVGAEFCAERGAWLLGNSRPPANDFESDRGTTYESKFEQQVDQACQADSLAENSKQSSAVAEVAPDAEMEASEWEETSTNDSMANESLEELPEAVLEGAWQQITRARTTEGELITGWVKTEFQPGERTAVLHVAFCPPLAIAPQVEIEQLSGPAARIKAAQILPQGARLEIRLNVPAAEPEKIMLAFVATGQLSDN